MREKFEREGKDFWKDFGRSFELPPRLYFDYVNPETYKRFLKGYPLEGRIVLDVGAGYPLLKEEEELVPLASQLHEVLEKLGAKLVALDVAMEALKSQKEIGRKAILGDAFHLPFRDESIDGGAVILNLFNTSFRGKSGEEIFISPEECKKILEEVYRVLQKGRFVIVSNYGYTIVRFMGMKILGPEPEEIITPEMIKKLAQEVGFQKITNIPLDEKRIKLGKELALESFPQGCTVEIRGAVALLMEK